jgi:hypothetical protein
VAGAVRRLGADIHRHTVHCTHQAQKRLWTALVAK